MTALEISAFSLTQLTLAAVPLMVALHEGLAAGRTAADALHAAREQADTGSAAGFVASCAFTAFGAG